MRKAFLLIVFLLLMLGCSPQKPFLSPTDRHFVRSDDFHEYRGLYIYTLTQDGKLYFTHYPEKEEALPISQKNDRELGGKGWPIIMESIRES